MDIAKVLHMNGGVGDASYARNSFLQKRVMTVTETIRNEAIRRMYENCSSSARQHLNIAELGCSSGPNTLLVPYKVITIIDKIRRDQRSPNFQILLNDLPSNDFNTVFKEWVPRFRKQLEKETTSKEIGRRCFLYGVPGSFYTRLFQSESLHFVHSSYSLHWLSQVPENLKRGNKGQIFLTSSSPKGVMEAWYQQFTTDFSTFLKYRSEEMVTGGCMVFTLPGRKEGDHFSERSSAHAFNLISSALRQMVSEGFIEEEKLDSFNVPIYMPSQSEIRDEIEKQGSFEVNSMEVSEVGWEHAAGNGEEGYIGMSGCMRAVMEPLLVAGFGQHLMENVFTRYAEIVRDSMAKETCVWVNLSVSLTKIK